MNNELVQTGFFDVGEVSEERAIQPAFNREAVITETKQLVKEDNNLKKRQEDIEIEHQEILWRRTELRFQIGVNLLELQAQHANEKNGDFTTSTIPEIDISISKAYECMDVADLILRKFQNTFRDNNFRGKYFPWKTWRELGKSSTDDTIVEQVIEGTIEATPKAIKEAQRKFEELQEEKQELQRDFDFFKEARKREEQKLNNKIQAVENEKTAKENEILRYKQLQATLGNVAQLQEKLRSEARKQLDKDLEKQRQEQKAELKKKEKELKDTYARKEQEYQLKAENTIRSLLSHGIKSMAETQLTIEHTVSAGMLQAVQQLGGKQVDSFLAQAESLQEELDRVIAKLTQGDYIALTERISVNG